MATNRQRYMISVDDQLRKAIEDFRFEKRFNTMSEATQELIRLGLKEYQKVLTGSRPYVIPDFKIPEDDSLEDPDKKKGD